MVQGYYTLQEAAQFLGIPVEDLKQMAQKGQIRSFQDRGNLRFRIQDIQELARVRSASSDPELVLGESASAAPPKSAATPAGRRKSQIGPKSPPKQEQVPDVFEFEFDNEDVDLGADFLGPKSGGKSAEKSKFGSKGGKKFPTPVSPSPAAGSDSDVRLVSDGSDVSFSIPKDSDIKLADSAVIVGQDPHRPKTGMQPSPGGGKRSSQVSLGSGVQTSKTSLSKKQQASPKPASGAQPVDSGVRLIPLDSDSDVKILGASDEVPLGEHMTPAHADSNVRLQRVQLPPADSGEGNMMQTEEINLDEEIRKLEERDKKSPPSKLSKMKAKSELKFPTTSPFELSDSEMKMPSELKDDSGPKTPTKQVDHDADSSDFDLQTPGSNRDDSSDFDLLPSGSDSVVPDDSDFSLELPSDDPQEQVLREEASGEMNREASGISLGNPVDAGISLEGGSGARAEEGMDFDLSLEVEDTPRPTASSPADDSDSDFQLQVDKTPQPVESRPADDSDSEFELSLDSDSAAPASQAGEESDVDFSLSVDSDQSALPSSGDSSEFELNINDVASGEKAESDSEFELTLDDSGNISSSEAEDDAAPQVKSKGKKTPPASDAEQDIFETDFEVPALDDSSEGTIADSELESSDFDLALDDSELAPEEESGSQVVALDEEDAETLVDSDADAADDVEVEEESSDFGDLDQDVQAEQGAEGEGEGEGDVGEVEGEAATGPRETIIKEKLLPAAPWGAMPVVFMLPCVVIMFLVGILGYELIQTSTGLRSPGPLTLAIADMIGQQITVKK